MATVNVKVLEPAEHFGFMTPAEARIGMAAAGSVDISDESLQFMIDQNSSIISVMAERTFARQKVRETWRCLGEPCDCADAATSRRLFLSHFPVREEDLESVEAPRGYALSPSDYELEERSGVLSIFGSIAEPIVVTYTGGYNLPDEAPPALKYMATLLVQQEKAQAQAQAMAGIRMIAHKSARIVYHQETTKETAGGRGGTSLSPAMIAVQNLLSHFVRRWM